MEILKIQSFFLGVSCWWRWTSANTRQDLGGEEQESAHSR